MAWNAKLEAASFLLSKILYKQCDGSLKDTMRVHKEFELHCAAESRLRQAIARGKEQRANHR